MQKMLKYMVIFVIDGVDALGVGANKPKKSPPFEGRALELNNRED
jgi:hypothetical protein